MLLCKVTGAVTSQLKEGCLAGKKLLICEEESTGQGEKQIAVDLVGVTIGAKVLVSIKTGMASQNDYCDAYIVALVDE